MPIDIYTARMGYTGPDWLDVSLQGNMRRAETEVGGHRGVGYWFAPPPSLLYPFLSARKHGKETPETQALYREAYLEHLRARYQGETRRAFDEVLSWPRVVLLCFCPPGAFCHRILLAEVLQAVGARRGLEVRLRGELERGQELEGPAFWRPSTQERLEEARPGPLTSPAGEQLIIGEGNKCRPFEVRSSSGERIGGGFICGGRSSKTCRGLPGCSRKAKFMCDFPLAGDEGKTCDRPLCAACAKVIGTDLHYCPSHQALDPEGRRALR